MCSTNIRNRLRYSVEVVFDSACSTPKPSITQTHRRIDTSSLKFESRFESGNLRQARRMLAILCIATLLKKLIIIWPIQPRELRKCYRFSFKLAIPIITLRCKLGKSSIPYRDERFDVGWSNGRSDFLLSASVVIKMWDMTFSSVKITCS